MTSTPKPPYRVPLLSEIKDLPWNGLKVVSTFSGAGGSCTGYRMAGYKVVWANEFVPAAQESYKANADPGCYLDPRDIKLIKPEEILAVTGLKQGELDIFDGSPPCQAFSTAGQREKGWGKDKKYEHGASQQNETLFSEYIRLLRGLQPRAFIAENVSGLVKGTAKGFFLEILAELKASGYQVECKLLDAKWLGVPQSRQRVIFIGTRVDLGVSPVFPKPLPYYYTVRDALPYIMAVGTATHPDASKFGGSTAAYAASGRQDQFVSPDLPSGSILASGPNMTNGYVLAPISSPPLDQQKTFTSLDKPSLPMPSPLLPVAPSRLKDGAYDARTVDLDKPCPTVTCASPGNDLPVPFYGEQDISTYAIDAELDKLAPRAGITHPTQKRKFTISELIRICSFPDDFILLGSYSQQWERLGNSVPPVMMSHIARSLASLLLSLS